MAHSILESQFSEMTLVTLLVGARLSRNEFAPLLPAPEQGLITFFLHATPLGIAARGWARLMNGN